MKRLGKLLKEFKEAWEKDEKKVQERRIIPLNGGMEDPLSPETRDLAEKLALRIVGQEVDFQDYAAALRGASLWAAFSSRLLMEHIAQQAQGGASDDTAGET